MELPEEFKRTKTAGPERELTVLRLTVFELAATISIAAAELLVTTHCVTVFEDAPPIKRIVASTLLLLAMVLKLILLKDVPPLMNTP